MIAAALRVSVEEHDDNSQPRMYDLRIRYPDRPVAAVEVTAAADSEAIQLWKLVKGSDERWLVEGLAGGWMVLLRPAARARRVLSELPSLLGELEAKKIRWLDADDSDRNELVRRASALGIASASQGGTDYPGSVYLTIELPGERSGGVVSDSGNPVAEWVGRFLREPGNADVLRKLKTSGADERHASCSCRVSPPHRSWWPTPSCARVRRFLLSHPTCRTK